MGATSHSRSTTLTLGGMLEHDRLAVRAARLKRILTHLGAQAAKHSGEETAPARARKAAVAEYEDELTRVRARLEQIS